MNLLRSLVYDDQVSLTLADTTEIVRDGIRLHKLTPASAYVYGKAMSAMAFLSGCLKEESGEISLTAQCDGDCGDIGASGNKALYLRGYIGNSTLTGAPNGERERLALGGGSLTIVRDDGYNRPFVGSCAFPQEGDFDRILEEYYRISEQLPTRIRTAVEFDENGGLLFAGVVALQPLPFADEGVKNKVKDARLEEVLSTLYKEGIEGTARRCFSATEYQTREAVYRCHCSREYLLEVLVTLGESQLREIIESEGAVRVHCHYCNTDYEFTAEDADRLFPKKV